MYFLGRDEGDCARHLDYWMKQPIFDNGGILTVGYTYPNLLMSETYNAPGSPYWALRLCILDLPDDHPSGRQRRSLFLPLSRFTVSGNAIC